MGSKNKKKQNKINHPPVKKKKNIKETKSTVGLPEIVWKESVK